MSGQLERLLEQATPGPWRIDSRFPRGVNAGNRAVATAEKVGRGREDARLIALAPDLARLLVDAMALMDRTVRGDWELTDMEALLDRFDDIETNVNDRIDIHDEVLALCEALDLEPAFVKQIDLTPTSVTATIYRKDENGSKHVVDGEVAVETREFEVTT